MSGKWSESLLIKTK